MKFCYDLPCVEISEKGSREKSDRHTERRKEKYAIHFRLCMSRESQQM